MSKINEEAIIARIKKLLRHAESAAKLGSQAEAETFSNKVNELLLEYNLEMAQVQSSPDEDKFATWTYAESISFADNQSGNRWKKALVYALCEYNFCSSTINAYTKTFRVYGQMQNVDTVIWMYNYLSVGLLRLAQEKHMALTPTQKATYNRYAYLKDFLLGAVAGLEQKLEAQRKSHQQANALTGLMIVNKDALNEFVKKAVPDLKQARKPKIVMVGHGYTSGVKAGMEFQVGGALGSPNYAPKPKAIGS